MIPYRLTSVLLSLSLVLYLLSGCRQSSGSREDREFSAFTAECFKEIAGRDAVSLHFKLADPSAYGIAETACRAQDISLDTRKKYCTRAGILLKKLRSFDRSALSPDRQLTRDIFERKLMENKEAADYLLYSSYLGKNGLSSQIPVSLSEYCFYNEKDVRNYLAILNTIPDLFRQMIEYEKTRCEAGMAPPDFAVKDTIEQIDQFLAGTKEDQLLLVTFKERIDSVPGLSQDQKKSYIKNNEALFNQVVVPAFESLKTTLASWETAAPDHERLSRYDRGKEYYEFLLRANTGTDKKPEEWIRFLEKQLKTMTSEMAALNRSTPDLYADYLAASPVIDDPEKILEDLKSAVSAEFPHIQDIPYVLKDLPSSLAGTSAAAFYLIPPIDIRDENIIYINRLRLEDKELFSTLAHEGYPGHLFQTNYYMEQNPDPLRYLLGTPGYDEGWGTYAQLCSYNYMKFTDRDPEKTELLRSLYRYNDLVALTLYSLSDLYVNYMDYDRDALAVYLSGYGIGKDNASAIYEYVVENPTTYLTYCTGYYEFQELKETCQKELQEDFDIQKFHTLVLNCGSCPFDILKKRILVLIRK